MLPLNIFILFTDVTQQTKLPDQKLSRYRYEYK